MAYAQGHMDTPTLLALRMLLSLPFFVLMAWLGSRKPAAPRLTRRDWLLLFWFGFIGYYFSSFLDFLALQYISAALERLILFTYPTIVVLLSAALYGRSIHGKEMLALLLSFGGIALVFVEDLKITQTPRELWIGGSLVFCAAFTYSLYLVGNTKLLRRLGSMRFTGLTASTASLFVLGHFFSGHSIAALYLKSSLFTTVLALAFLSTVIPVWLTSEALRLIGPSRVAIIGSVGPICTIWMGALFLGEPVSATTYAGALLVLAGVFLVTNPFATQSS